MLSEERKRAIIELLLPDLIGLWSKLPGGELQYAIRAAQSVVLAPTSALNEVITDRGAPKSDVSMLKKSRD